MPTAELTRTEGKRVVSSMEIVQRRVREIREEAKLTQKALASAMRAFGFEWTEMTVTQIERGSRKVSLDELVSLAALWHQPVVSFLSAGDDEMLALPGGRVLAPETVRELLVGAGGTVGRGGAFWKAAADVVKSGTGSEALSARVFTESTLLAEELAQQRGELKGSKDATAQEAARQGRLILQHLPVDELPDEIEFEVRDGLLVVVRPADGAIYGLAPDNIGGGVIRVTVENGQEVYTHFRDGKPVGVFDGPVPPHLANLN